MRINILLACIILMAASHLSAEEIHDASLAGDLAKVQELVEGNPDVIQARDE